MEKTEDEDWRVVLKFWGVMALFAAIIKLGALSIVLTHDLNESKCVATYWKARALGHPPSYCPRGCECGPALFR